MKKQYNLNKLTDNLSSSVFFQENKTETRDTQPMQNEANIKPNATDTKASNNASKLASTLSRQPKTKKPISNTSDETVDSQDTMIEAIRKTVKEVGKETLFLRMTPEEKDRLKDIVYSLSKQRPKISENEIGRIALSYLLEDFKENGKNSILAKMIEALNA